MSLADKVKQVKSSYGLSKKEQKRQIEDSKYPRVAEPALVHPHNSSTIKLRDDGSIDLFVGTDNGIRIDPVNKTINVIGSRFQQRVGSAHSVVQKSVTYQTGTDWVVQAKGKVNITGNAINLTSKAAVKITAPDLRVSGTIHSGDIHSGAIHSGEIYMNGQRLTDLIRQIAQEVAD